MKDATFEEIIEIQTQQLEDWKMVLKPEVHKELVKFAIKNNNDFKDNPYGVCRGTDLDTFIGNYHLKIKKDMTS